MLDLLKNVSTKNELKVKMRKGVLLIKGAVSTKNELKVHQAFWC